MVAKTNQYFTSNYFAVQKDQALVNNLVREAIQQQGIAVKYIRRSFVNLDKLFGEDQSSAFERSYDIELYLKSVDAFGGDGNFLSKFGLEIRDEITFTIHRDRFTEEVVANEPEIIRPMEGDLIWVGTEVDKKARVFEITYVNSEETYYQLGKLYTWEIKTKVFEYAGETFDTGVDAIDSIEEFSIDRTLLMSPGGIGNYMVGEGVTSTGGSGDVVSWDPITRTLTVTNITGTVTSGQVVGTISDAAWTVQSVLANNVSETTNSDNDFIDQKMIDIVRFDEINPFSE